MAFCVKIRVNMDKFTAVETQTAADFKPWVPYYQAVINATASLHNNLFCEINTLRIFYLQKNEMLVIEL